MRTTIIAGLALALLATSACSALDRDGTDDDGGAIRAGLAQLPQPGEDAYTVRVVDLDGATEAAGLERPTELDAESTAAWTAPLAGAPGEDDSFVPVPAPMPVVTHQRDARVEEFDEIAGWSVIDVSSYAEVVTPPETFAALSGDFDATALEHLPEVGDGVRTVGEGEDGRSDPGNTSAVQPVGMPVRMAEQDGSLAVSPSTDAVKEWLEGPEDALADDPTASALGEALDEQDVMVAELVIGQDFGVANLLGRPGADGPDPPPTDRVGSLPEDPFDAVAVGWRATEDEPQVIIAYHFADEDIAQSSVDPLKEVFASGKRQDGSPVSTDFEIAEITAEGPVVTAVLDPQQARSHIQVRDALQTRDAPFLHG